MTITPLLRIKERICGPSGIYGIQNEWYGYADEFKYTIGLAGLMGFGVGCCPPELLPDDMAALPGTEDRFSPNYGNYIHIPSASILCFIPAHYIEIQAPGNTNAPTFGTKVVISSAQAGAGVLARSFRDNGADLAGVFVDKYQGSNVRPDGSGLPNSSDGNPGTWPNAGGVFASRPLHWPATPIFGGSHSPFSLCNSTALNSAATTPTNDDDGVWAVCRSRGADFHPLPIWTRIHLGFLALAHAQALLDATGAPVSGATNNAAWMDVTPYAPKGNNNNGYDANKGSLRFMRTDIAGYIGAGYAGTSSRAFTGAALINGVPATQHTTHNGQLSGIVDVNGNQWDLVPGLLGDSNNMFYLFSDQGSWASLSSKSAILSSPNKIALLLQSTGGADDGIWSGSDVFYYLIPHFGGTFHPSSRFSEPGRGATLRAMTECGIPRQPGTSSTSNGTNHFGGDSFHGWRFGNNRVGLGGYWAGASDAGVFGNAVGTGFKRPDTSFGARATRLLAP